MSALEESIKVRFEALIPVLDARTRRVWPGVEAKSIGRGSIARVSAVTGMLRDTVRAGLREVEAGGTIGRGTFATARGGRKALEDRDPELRAALQRQLDPVGEIR